MYDFPLTQLEPQFLKRVDDSNWQQVDTLAEADGIEFVCPKCLHLANMHRPGVHSVVCWSPVVPQTTSPTPGRWEMHGTNFNDLSLVAGSSSIFLTGQGCGAHFFIKDGRVYE